MALTLHGTVADNTVVLDRRSAKPLIINGDMQITQRATSKTGITSTTMEVQDRWSDVMGGAGTWTQTSDTDVPSGQGFTKSMKWDCTASADLSDNGQIFSVRYIFEGQDVQLLKYGSSNAEKLTLSFWIKSPKTGTHILSFYQYDDARHVSKAYTISSANTWTKVVCSIPGDTTGVIDNDNGAGLGIEIGLSAGSTYTSGTLATSWAAYSAANQWVGQVNCADSTDNNVFITGVQLEVGEFDADSIPPFQHESYGDSLARCQRYFFKTFAQGTTPAQNVAANNVIVNGAHTAISNDRFPDFPLPVEMRAAGTATSFNPFAANSSFRVPGSSTDVAISSIPTQTCSLYFVCSSADTGTFHIHFTVASEL
jgi:hypothetical protein